MFGLGIGRVEKESRQLASVLSFNHDGLRIARVREKKRWLPVWHVVFFIYVVWLVRLISMIEMGPASYGNRIAQLENGSTIDRFTAGVMYVDPVSHQIANEVRATLRQLGLK